MVVVGHRLDDAARTAPGRLTKGWWGRRVGLVGVVGVG